MFGGNSRLIRRSKLQNVVLSAETTSREENQFLQSYFNGVNCNFFNTILITAFNAVIDTVLKILQGFLLLLTRYIAWHSLGNLLNKRSIKKKT